MKVDRLDLLRDAGALVAAAMTHMRIEFRDSLSEDDYQEIAQTAYAELLSQHRRGYPVENARALIKTAAWRRADKRRSRGREVATDPSEGPFTSLGDARATTHENFENWLDLVSAAEALAQLPREVQLVFRYSRSAVSPAEGARRLGIKRSTYFKYSRQATEYVTCAMAGENPAYEAALRELVSELVVASEQMDEDARRRAQRVVRSDPHAAALAREAQRANDLLGAAVPPLALGEVFEANKAEVASSTFERLRDGISGLLGRTQETAEAALAPIASTGGMRGAGAAAGGGVLGTLGLGGGAAKIVAGCLVGGAAATACVVAGVLPAPALPDLAGADDEPQVVSTEAESRPRPAAPASTLPSQVGHDGPEPAPEPAKEAERNDREGGGEEAAPAPEPVVASTAPAPVQELSPESAGVPVDASGTPTGGGSQEAADANTEFGP